MITLDTNTISESTGQYEGFEFNSMVKFGKNYLGVNAEGLFVIGAPNDNGVQIDASFELPTFDLGSDDVKRIRFLYLGGELYGGMMVTLYCDDKPIGSTYEIPINSRGGQQTIRVPIGHDDQGRYWRPVFTNVNGCDFSVDKITVLPIVLHPGHGSL